MRGAGGGGGGKASGSTEGYRKDFGLILHAGRMRRIQTLRAFRRPQPGGLEACRLGGLETWKGLEWLGKAWKELEAWRTGAKGSLGLENGCFGAGKLVPGRPKWRLGPPNWRQNGSGRPKSGLGRSRDVQNWFLDGLEGGLEGLGLAWTAILGVQGPVWTPSSGHLGGLGGVSEAIFEDLGVPNGSGKAIFWIQSGKVQSSKILCFPICF